MDHCKPLANWKKWAFLLMLFVMGSWSNMHAQIYPISVNTQILPPYSAYLSEYLIPGNERFKVNVFFNDEQEPSLEVKLRLTIEGNGFTLTTSPNFAAPPIVIQSGTNFLDGSDLDPYLNFANMQATGPINLNQLISNGKLPEGMYSFCVEVLDYRESIQLALPGCGMATIQQNNPPRYTMPVEEEIVSAAGAPNIQFAWQPDHAPSIPAVYDIRLVEVPEGVNPYDAMANATTPILDWVEVSVPSFTYGPNELPLDPGSKYAWQVRVRDPREEAVFENQGLGQVWWFHYGFSTGGNVPLSQPTNEKDQISLTKVDLNWQGPDNLIPGQQVYYQILAKTMSNNGNPAQVLSAGPYALEEETDIYPHQSGGSFSYEPSDGLEPQTWYAWKVEAYTDGIKVAESEAWKFRTQPLFDVIYGASGSRAMTVEEITQATKIDTENYKEVSGTGKVDIGGGKIVEFTFSDIKVKLVAGKWNLEEGELIGDYSDAVDLEFGDSGSGELNYDNILIDPQDMKIRGVIDWNYPLPTMAPEMAVISSAETDFVFDEGKVTGSAGFPEGIQTDLLSPMGFSINWDTASSFVVSENDVQLLLTGLVTCPDKVATIEEKAVAFPFEAVSDPLYFENSSVVSEDNLALASNTKFEFKPEQVVFDFSEAKSFREDIDLEWKGVLLKKYQVVIPKDVDESEQLKLDKKYVLDFDMETDTTVKCWISTGGLTVQQYLPFESEDKEPYYATMSGFQGKLYGIDLRVSDGSFDSSAVEGFIKIPLFDNSDVFDFVIPIAGDGFKAGYFEEGLLEGLDFYYQADHEKGKTILSVNKAVFVDNEFLEFNLDVEWPAADLLVEGLSNVRLWPNGDFGISEPNGYSALQVQTEGVLDGKYPLVIDSVGFFRKNLVWSIAWRGNIHMSEDMGGEDGTRFAANLWLAGSAGNPPGGIGAGEDGYGFSPSENNNNQGGNTNGEELGSGEELAEGEEDEKVKVLPISVKIKNKIIEVEANLEYMKGDEVWGSRFSAQAEGTFKLWAERTIGLHLVIGRAPEEGEYGSFSYGYIRGYGKGLGIPVGATALEVIDVAIYWNLKKEYELDPETEPEDTAFHVVGDGNFGKKALKRSGNMLSRVISDKTGGSTINAQKEVVADAVEIPYYPYKQGEKNAFGMAASLGFIDAKSLANKDKPISMMVLGGLELMGCNKKIEYFKVFVDLYWEADRSEYEEKHFARAGGLFEIYPQDKKGRIMITGGINLDRDPEKRWFSIAGSIEGAWDPKGWYIKIGSQEDPLEAKFDFGKKVHRMPLEEEWKNEDQKISSEREKKLAGIKDKYKNSRQDLTQKYDKQRVDNRKKYDQKLSANKSELNNAKKKYKADVKKAEDDLRIYSSSPQKEKVLREKKTKFKKFYRAKEKDLLKQRRMFTALRSKEEDAIDDRETKALWKALGDENKELKTQGNEWKEADKKRTAERNEKMNDAIEKKFGGESEWFKLTVTAYFEKHKIYDSPDTLRLGIAAELDLFEWTSDTLYKRLILSMSLGLGGEYNFMKTQGEYFTHAGGFEVEGGLSASVRIPLTKTWEEFDIFKIMIAYAGERWVADDRSWKCSDNKFEGEVTILLWTIQWGKKKPTRKVKFIYEDQGGEEKKVVYRKVQEESDINCEFLSGEYLEGRSVIFEKEACLCKDVEKPK